MNEVAEIGQELVRYAKNEADFSAQRGLVEELFPYIWMASRRMSLRAISQWLESTKGVSLSANTISRAMRNQEKHWLAFAETVEPVARVFGAAHDMSWEEVLDLEDEAFEHVAKESASIPSCSRSGEDGRRGINEYESAESELRDIWFSLPVEARDACMVQIFKKHKEDETEGSKTE